ncbi:CAP domain-containing protein [Candidatus Woesebacteria bacterium]|nr:CAP domain-containing protein [Candidatus Woesebacteria bacterium]
MKHIVDTIHHFFIPKHTNNYRAKLLHHDFLTVYLIAAIFLTFSVGHYKKTHGNILGYATDISVNKLFTLTNGERTANDLPTLKLNDKLSEAARQKAKDMFEKNYWNHYGPDGETPWTFILSSGYQYEYAGENLAKNFLFSDGVVKAWMDSPTHRENMLRPEYTDVGFAVVNGVLNNEETTLVVQMFGKPLYAQETTTDTPTTETNQLVQANKQTAESVLANTTAPVFYNTYFDLNIVFLSVLILALFFDVYFATKLNIIRLRGKNLIHMLFLGFVLYGAFIIIQGSIT